MIFKSFSLPIKVYFLSFLPLVGVCVSLGTMHLVNRNMSRLELRMAHTDAQFDMLMTANEELHKLLVAYIDKR